VDKVWELLQNGEYDAVAVELCPSRYQALMDPDPGADGPVFRNPSGPRLYGRGDSGPGHLPAAAGGPVRNQAGAGVEQRAAVAVARERHLPVLLVDREIGVTLKRAAENLTWWKRFGLFSGLVAILLSREEVTEEEIKHLKEGDVLETIFAEFARDRWDLYVPYLAARLREEIAEKHHGEILAYSGQGTSRAWQVICGRGRDGTRGPRSPTSTGLPPPKRWPKLIP